MKEIMMITGLMMITVRMAINANREGIRIIEVDIPTTEIEAGIPEITEVAIAIQIIIMAEEETIVDIRTIITEEEVGLLRNGEEMALERLPE
jgi:hypothetical protein